MKTVTTASAVQPRGDKMREIVQGIYDNDERDLLLRFIWDCEQSALSPARTTKTMN